MMRHEGTKARRHAGGRGTSRLGRRAGGAACRRAFTLIELLVVIAVIGILIAAIGFAGVMLIRHQRAKYTEAIIRNVSTAIDQFATEDPLRQIYNKPGSATFGPYPPYQVDGDDSNGAIVTVRDTFGEPSGLPGANGALLNYSLGNRLWRDFCGGKTGSGNRVDYVNQDVFDHETGPNPDRRALDNRALYAYLAVYGGGVLNQVPADRIKPFHAGDPEIVNPTGGGTLPGAVGATSLLGIFDAWDVPLNYMLAVKLDYSVDPRTETVAWRMVDRRPLVISRGITRDDYDASATVTSTLSADDETKLIKSGELPTPYCGKGTNDFGTSGKLPIGDPRNNGWVRARGVGTRYAFVP